MHARFLGLKRKQKRSRVKATEIILGCNRRTNWNRRHFPIPLLLHGYPERIEERR